MRLIDADTLIHFCLQECQKLALSKEEYFTFEKIIKLVEMQREILNKEEYRKHIAKEVVVMRTPNEDVKVGNLRFKAGCKLEKCPTCDNFLSNDIYCRYCGQKLKRKKKG